ncbi:MAG: hypothetical protein ABIP68_00410, partial [Ferruginibacter sp.]
MKKLFIILSFSFTVFLGFAQSPSLMSYQAVIRNATGILITEQPVGVRFKIIQYNDAGTTVYSESHSGTTNKNGLITLKIGAGTIITGNFNNINWGDGPYFLQVETDPAGGTSYSISNVSQMLSVPYALYAKTSGSDALNWGLLGNTATASNFIGTTNDQPIIFKSNNEIVGYLGNGSNIFFGSGAGVENSGISNTAIGSKSLYSNTTGNYNTAIGYQSGYSNTTGILNTVIGTESFFSNISGKMNCAYGHRSLYSNSTGEGNSGYGVGSLTSNVSGQDNTANGNLSTALNTTGSFNTATGSNSLYANTTGRGNTSAGFI